MAGWVDANWLRVAGYAIAAGAALLAGLRERRLARQNPSLWPTFWFLNALVLLVMAIGRAADIGDLITTLGRSEAFSGGWYAHRRKFQALAVGTVGAAWLVTVAIALWRVPERRRRYLPGAIVVFTLMCFAGVRLISLHQVDGLLDRRHISGVKVGTLIELALLVVMVAVTFWQPRGSSRTNREPLVVALEDAHDSG